MKRIRMVRPHDKLTARGGKMKGSLIGIAAGIAAFTASPVHAMNWCALPQIIPEREADVERLAPSVEPLTGCARQPSDSTHMIKWMCPDNLSTADTNEAVLIMYIREPGKSINLIVGAFGLADLGMLRRCGIRDLKDEERFSPGNVAYRDRIKLGIVGPRLTLTSVILAGMGVIISDTKTYGEDPSVTALWQGIHGITVENYPSTSVKLAGVSPISTDVLSIVGAFEARGSAIKQTEALEEELPVWTLTPPIGLGGVTEVRVEGFLRHLLRAHYTLGSTGDYERFIGLLDAEYGKSERSSVEGCTYRWWESGRVSIRGEHCPAKSEVLTFYNDVATDQLVQVSEKLQADDDKSDASPAIPAIDVDMF